MNTVGDMKKTPIATAIALAIVSWQSTALAQEAETDDGEVVEEVVVLGRLISSSQELVNERINDSYVSDLLGADTISRLGDSTVGAALRRVPGLSLVSDKYVYIRGLGERYSATSLNGAQIPSPDLTRNVIPLDVFPTSIVESLRVQKAWSADLPANFGGGSVDIRTRGIPDSFVLNFELGSGANSLQSNDGITYAGGGDDSLGTDDGTRALSADLLNSVNEFQGNVGVQQILSFLRGQDPAATLADAQLVNRNLALQLNRNISIEEGKDLPMDVSARECRQ